MTKGVLRLLRVGMNVSELDRASAFYCDALGFSVIDRGSYETTNFHVGDDVRVQTERLRLGRQQIELHQFDPPGTPYPHASTAADLWFQHFAIVTRDMAGAYDRLQRHSPIPITRDGPQRLPPADGSVVAYKFRDPDRHPLELIYFPSGDVGTASQLGVSGPTTGIDHSALSVAEPERSIAFYNLLGLSMRSRRVNAGPGQDRLDGLSDVSVDVIALFPTETLTPHIELLSYANPRGRAALFSETGRDSGDSRLVFGVADLAGLIQELASADISPSSIVNDGSGESVAYLRDPDGHLIILLQEN